MFDMRSRKKKILLQLILLLMTIPYAVPLVQMVLGSLGGIGLGNYKAVWDTGVVPVFFRNSAIISAGVIVLVYFFSMTAGFAFAKLHIAGKEVFFWLILAALTLPEVILLTPLFVTFQKLHMYNTFFAVILPSAALQLPFAILLTLINAWNAYLLPLLFLQSPKLQTVTLLPQFFQGEFTNDQTKILAAAVLTAVPEIIAYLCMQKSFEKGMSAGALK